MPMRRCSTPGFLICLCNNTKCNSNNNRPCTRNPEPTRRRRCPLKAHTMRVISAIFIRMFRDIWSSKHRRRILDARAGAIASTILCSSQAAFGACNLRRNPLKASFYLSRATFARNTLFGWGWANGGGVWVSAAACRRLFRVAFTGYDRKGFLISKASPALFS